MFVHTSISLLINQRTFIRQSTRSLLNEQRLINERVYWSINALLTNDLVYCSMHENVAVSTHAAFVIWRISWESTFSQSILCSEVLLADLSSILRKVLCSEASLADLTSILCSEVSFSATKSLSCLYELHNACFIANDRRSMKSVDDQKAYDDRK